MSLFITFEGGEGCGKSYQSKALYNRLIKLGLAVVKTHEPGGTSTGERITRLLKWGKGNKLSPLTELLLFNASRSQLIDSVIKPALEAGHIVICDRFTDSTIAYQGYGRGLDSVLINKINDIASQNVKPDITILLDMPPEEGLRRKNNRKPDRFHEENLVFHQKVRQGFLELSKKEPGRWLVIDGYKTKAEISQIIWDKIQKLLIKSQSN